MALPVNVVVKLTNEEVPLGINEEKVKDPDAVFQNEGYYLLSGS